MPDAVSSLVVRGYHSVLISSVPSQQTMEIQDDERADIDRKFKALLNKLTMRNFRSIAERITALVNRPQDEKGAVTRRVSINRSLVEQTFFD